MKQVLKHHQSLVFVFCCLWAVTLKKYVNNKCFAYNVFIFSRQDQ